MKQFYICIGPFTKELKLEIEIKNFQIGMCNKTIQ